MPTVQIALAAMEGIRDAEPGSVLALWKAASDVSFCSNSLTEKELNRKLWLAIGRMTPEPKPDHGEIINCVASLNRRVNQLENRMDRAE